MKKVLLILLALVIAGGVVFAAPADAKLELKAKAIDAVLRHGFRNATIGEPSFSTVSAGLTATPPALIESDAILDLEGHDSQNPLTIGYYYFAANSANTAYEVKFTVNPFEKSDSLFMVPWTLNIGKIGSSGASFTVITDEVLVQSISTDGTIGGSIEPSDAVTVFKTEFFEEGESGEVGYATGSKPSWVGLQLAAYTTAVANKAYGLPATVGDDVFTATVVASVSAQ